MGRCRLCLVGCGAIAQRHAAAIRLLNVRMLDSDGAGEPQPAYVEVVAAADPAADAAAQMARDFADHRCASFASLEEALEGAGDSFDAVLLMTPPALNQRLTRLALSSGKAVWLQKPLAITEELGAALLEDVAALRDEGHDSALLVSEHSQWWPEILAAQQLIEDGRIGEVITARSSFYGGLGGILDPEGWRRSTQQCGGGIVIDGGTHWVRPLRMWLGEVVEVTGATQRLTAHAEGETLAKAILRHADGRMSSLEAIALPAPCAFSPQVIPTPLHVLDRILPVFPPFPPIFCAFSPS